MTLYWQFNQAFDSTADTESRITQGTASSLLLAKGRRFAVDSAVAASAYGNIAFAPTSTLWVGCWIRINSYTATAGSTDVHILHDEPWSGESSGDTTNTWKPVLRCVTSVSPYVIFRLAGAEATAIDSGPLYVGQWHRFEFGVHRDASAGWTELWMDGVKIATRSNLSNAKAGGMTAAMLGYILQRSADGGTLSAINYDLDQVRIGTTQADVTDGSLSIFDAAEAAWNGNLATAQSTWADAHAGTGEAASTTYHEASASRSGGGTRMVNRGYLRFSLTGLPAGNVLAATVRLARNSGYGPLAGATPVTQINQATDWGASQAAWTPTVGATLASVANAAWLNEQGLAIPLTGLSVASGTAALLLREAGHDVANVEPASGEYWRTRLYGPAAADVTQRPSLRIIVDTRRRATTTMGIG